MAARTFYSEWIKYTLVKSPVIAQFVPKYLVLCAAIGLYDLSKHFGVPRFTESYWLSRVVYLRSVAFLYFVAFLVSFHQNPQLIGDNGLLPARLYLKRLINAFDGKRWEAFYHHPTFLLFVPTGSSLDTWLNIFGFCGLMLSGFVLIKGAANIVILFVLWSLYHSIVTVGQRWFGFGWESQLLEVGFLAMFLTPLLSINPFPKYLPTSFVCIWGSRWLSYRIMLGAGLIKVPNFLSYYLHQTPPIVHKMETFGNHIVELVCPWLLLIPIRSFRIAGGVAQILFQVILIISGNLSFLNWLTILPNLLCFDDQFLSFLFSKNLVEQAKELKRQEVSRMQFILSSLKTLVTSSNTDKRPILAFFFSVNMLQIIFRSCLHLVVAILLTYLSIPVVKNLMANHQIMNTSFDTFRLVNTYGAFGSVTKRRYEVIIRGSNHEKPSDEGHWLEYEFKVKPGNLYQRPPWISPYHYRLDWLMWFAAFGSIDQHSWLIHLLYRLLWNDRHISSLLKYNPFINGKAPIWIRADLYEYSYAPIGSSEALSGKWWKRRYADSYVRPLRVDSPALVSIVRRMNWRVDYSPDQRDAPAAINRGFSFVAALSRIGLGSRDNLFASFEADDKFSSDEIRAETSSSSEVENDGEDDDSSCEMD